MSKGNTSLDAESTAPTFTVVTELLALELIPIPVKFQLAPPPLTPQSWRGAAPG